MRRLLSALALLAATSGAALADDAPTDGGVTPAADAGAQPSPSSPAAIAAYRARFKSVPPYYLQNAKVSGDPPHLPDDVKVRYRKAGLAVGMYKICIDTDGNVSAVEPVQSVAGGDAQVMSTLRTWKYKRQPLGLCSIVRFEWTISR